VAGKDGERHEIESLGVERLSACICSHDQENGMRDDAEVSSTFESITTAVMVGAVGIATIIVIAAMTLTVAPRQAEATPQFAQQTKLPCGQCHVNPGGSGKLKPFGQKFKDKGNRL